MPSKEFPLPVAAFALACILVFLAYVPGLSGPLLLDDVGNLADVGNWLNGERSWQSTIFNNRSGPGGRPLAMASFVLDAAIWGADTWHFKLSNLILHILCGVALVGLYRQLILRDSRLMKHRSWLPLLLAAIWLALPIHASSVLYVVQRMAMLSAFFMLLALWRYCVARTQIERNERRGIFELWLVVPALTVLAFLSKENGVLVPLIAFAIEIVYFRPAIDRPRPTAVTAFFLASLAVPLALVATAVVIDPERIHQGYELRNFTLYERVLTQTRVLWDYVGSVLIPYGPNLSLFHDDFPKSTGPLSPWTTLIALITWLASLIVAWRLRNRHPSILAGILIYLFGHAMESSVIALEIYFEHRNYFPSIGLLLAACGVVLAVADRLPTPTPLFRRTISYSAVVLVLVYVGVTHGRANVWSSSETLFAQELKFHSESPRLRSVLAGQAMARGDTVGALNHIAAAEKSSFPQDAMALSLWRMLAYCEGGIVPPSGAYSALRKHSHGKIQTFAMTAWELLAIRVESGSCPQVRASELSSIGFDWLRQNPLSGEAQQSWRTRYNLARLLASQGRFDEAIEQTEIAWRDSGRNNGIGVFLFQLHATVENSQRCVEIYQHLRRARGQGDFRLDQAIDAFGRSVEAKRESLRTTAEKAPPGPSR